MCLTGRCSSPSLHSSNASAPEPPPVPQFSPASPSKALKEASRSLSAVLKRCCSRDLDQVGTKDQQHDDMLVDVPGLRKHADESTAPRRVSRAVSTCNFFTDSGELDDQGKNTCSSFESKGVSTICSRSCACYCKTPESPCRQTCLWMHALRANTEDDVHLLFDTDYGRAPCCSSRAMPRHPCVPWRTHQNYCCLVTHLLEAGWRRPVRRSVSHDVLGCMASPLSTRCRCQPGNNFHQFHHEVCINSCLTSGISAGEGVNDARTPLSSRPSPCHSSREARGSVSPCGMLYKSSVHSFRESLEHRLLPDTLFLHDKDLLRASQFYRSCTAVSESNDKIPMKMNPSQLVKLSSAAEGCLADDRDTPPSGFSRLFRSASAVQLHVEDLPSPLFAPKRRLSVGELSLRELRLSSA